jgi:acetolactate synthase-1/2/3 large subunit
VYLDFGANLLKQPMADWYSDQRWFSPVEAPARLPAGEAIEAAARLLRDSKRPLVIGGRGALAARNELQQFLHEFGCLYLDTRESRGAVAPDNPFSIPALRARAMAEADLVITLGRRLDFELAYGSAAVFAKAEHFIRIGRTVEEISENRRGDVEVWGDVDQALQSLLDCKDRPNAPDTEWRDGLVRDNLGKSQAMAGKLAGYSQNPDDPIHPLALIGELNRLLDSDSICIVDGGDILSFARVGLQAHTYLDLGPFGCLGSGAPYAVAAALAFPARRVVALIGDGAFGFSAMEIETAVRCGARALFVIANNDAWNIERQHQVINYPGQDLGGELSPSRYDLLAQSMGAYGERVENFSDLAGALQRGLGKLPAVIDVAISRDAISPDTRSGLANLPEFHAIQSWDEAERRMLTQDANLL